jgi:3-oxoacyl-[acyl-carrier protein] reductase
MVSLSGKTALVTGSARGIGRAIAGKLAAAGAQVMLNDIDEKVLGEAVKEFEGAGYKVSSMSGDLTDPATPDKLVQGTLEKLGGLDIIVNNAGFSWDGVIQKTTDEQFQAMLTIHLVVPFRILRAAANHFRETAKAEIAEGKTVMRKVVNITSISGVDGNAGQSGYGAGKMGVVGLTKVLSKEWGRYNVNVNAVGFGLINTRMVQPLGGADASLNVAGHDIKIGVQPEMIELAKQSCSLKRIGSPDEAAGAVFFMCSPLSDYVTGEVLIAGGGFHF